MHDLYEKKNHQAVGHKSRERSDVPGWKKIIKMSN